MKINLIPFCQDETGSTLTINNVSVDDSGNYSCQPRDMRPDSVVVTILSEKQAPDALQDKTTHTSLASQQAPWAGNQYLLNFGKRP